MAREGLEDLTKTGWKLAADGKSISKTFRFKDFVRAFGFMSAAALVAERMDHHPDWTNVYNTVEVRLTTHSEDALTAKDTALAKAIDSLA